MALLTHQIAEPHDFAAVIDAVVAEILEHLAPLKLSFIGNIRQLLPQALFDHPHKDAISQLILTLFLTEPELFQIASDGANNVVDFTLR